MLPAASRLHTSAEFSAVVRGGVRSGGHRLVVHLRGNRPESSPSGGARAGFVVSGKVGNAVVRHRITRQLRPLMRHRLADLPAGTDVVVRVLPDAVGATSAELAVELDESLRRSRRRWDRRVDA